MDYIIVNGELYHHGIKGMKWGVRRYQNEDGSLTAEGMRRYGSTGAEYLQAKRDKRTAQKEYDKAFDKAYNKAHNAYSLSKKKRQENDERWNKAFETGEKSRLADKKFKEEKKKVRAYQTGEVKKAARNMIANEQERGRKYAKKGKNLTNTAFSHIGKVAVTDIAIVGAGALAAGIAAYKNPKFIEPIKTLTVGAAAATTWAYRIQDGRKAADILLYRYSKK